MAKQKNITIAGKVGNLIFYDHRGIPCVRTRPTRVRQSKATKQSAKLFGKATQIGKVLRANLAPIVADTNDRKLMHRLNTALLQWVRSTNPSKTETAIPSLYHFSFNESTSLQERLKFPLTVNWKIHDVPTLEIPSFNPVTMITAPAHTLSLTLDILITECTLDKYNSRGMYITHFDVKMERGEIPAQKIPLPFPLQPGSLNIVAVGISYTITKKGNTQILLAEQWLPAGIVDACFMSEP